jgi:hypothetical protein
MPSQRRAKEKRKKERQQQRSAQEGLAQQLRYIDRSCQIFDQGHWDEAIRIATQLRVILHQGSGKYKSLLQRLGVQNKVRLLSTCAPTASEKTLMYHGMGFFEYNSDGETATMSFCPNLGEGPYNAQMHLHEWWDQIVYVLPARTHQESPFVLRRKDIILTAANKDGGAHFDDLTPEYKRLAAPATTSSFVGTVDGVDPSTPIVGVHFVCLRQMGYEILQSAGLLSLLHKAA